MGSFYRITDYFDRNICLNAHGWLGPKINSDEYSDVILFVSDQNRNIGYIIPKDKKKVHCANDPFNEYVYSLNIFYIEDNKVAFTSVNNSAFLTSINYGWLSLETQHLQDWEVFTLEKFEYSEIEEIENVISTVNSIEKFLGKFNDFEKISNLDEKKEIVSGLFANIRHLKLDDLENICSHISKDPDWIDIIYEQDQSIWSLYGLKQLTSWLNDRQEKPAPYVVGNDFDFLSHEIVPPDGSGVRPSSAVEVIVRTIRALVKPKKDFCILATARNEGIYLAEWVAYHKSIGFDGIFIYINDCEDNSARILSSLEKEGYVEFFETVSKDGVNVQGKAYAHALGFLPQILDYRWVLIVDLDELFVYDKKRFANLKSYFEFLEKKQIDSVAFDWINIGSNKQINWNEKPYFDRFSNTGFHEDTKLKTAFRPARAAKAYPHFPIEFDNYSFIRRNSVGSILKTRQNEEVHGPLGKHLNDAPDSRFAVIYHYYFKSIEEYIWKSARNRGDHPKDANLFKAAFDEELVRWFLRCFEDDNTETSDRLSFPEISFLCKDFYKEYRKILSSPEIKHEISVNIDIYKKKIEYLVDKLYENKEMLRENQLKMISILRESFLRRDYYNR